jgi:hypothetical protein
LGFGVHGVCWGFGGAAVVSVCLFIPIYGV